MVELGSSRIGGIYGKYGVRVQAMQDWFSSLVEWIREGDWVLLGVWNSHQHRWSLDGRSGPGERV